MWGVDFRDKYSQYILDDGRKIPKAHLKSVCKLYQGKDTCRYVCLGTNGFTCVKNTPLKEVLDQQVDEGKISACGDNCEGLGDQKDIDNGQEEKG